MSLISVLNSGQAYTTLKFTKRVYSSSSSQTPAKTNSSNVTTSAYPDQVTPLSSRTFGTWTFLSAVIRLYAAYNISNPVVYQLALWTYGVALVHFVSEWWIFRTARWSAGLAGPILVATGSFIWMLTQWESYVQ